MSRQVYPSYHILQLNKNLKALSVCFHVFMNQIIQCWLCWLCLLWGVFEKLFLMIHRTLSQSKLCLVGDFKNRTNIAWDLSHPTLISICTASSSLPGWDSPRLRKLTHILFQIMSPIMNAAPSQPRYEIRDPRSVGFVAFGLLPPEIFICSHGAGNQNYDVEHTELVERAS